MKSAEPTWKKVHFFIEIFLWTCFAFSKCVRLDLENGSKKTADFYISDPSTTKKSHAERLFRSPSGKEQGLTLF